LRHVENMIAKTRDFLVSALDEGSRP